ncbi:MAG: WecB/TagA/CpsF family glycosyltransferase [Candidatus Moraniibacteriota bacterium]
MRSAYRFPYSLLLSSKYFLLTSVNVLNIPIDNLTRAAVLTQIDHWLAGGDTFHRIATVNPEFLLLAQKNAAFRGALLSADLRLADGVGLHLPFFLAGESLLERIPGADLLSEILQRADERFLSVGLILAPDGLSSFEAIKQTLHERYPNLAIFKFAPEYFSPQKPIPYNLVFCNYGAPLQEIVLAGLRQSAGAIRLVMGVGGAFDFLTGQISRAPKPVRSIGLEWAWRLLQQPKRFRRIWNAVVIFPMKVLSQK